MDGDNVAEVIFQCVYICRQDGHGDRTLSPTALRLAIPLRGAGEDAGRVNSVWLPMWCQHQE